MLYLPYITIREVFAAENHNSATKNKRREFKNAIPLARKKGLVAVRFEYFPMVAGDPEHGWAVRLGFVHGYEELPYARR